jgi:hypothetical protein
VTDPIAAEIEVLKNETLAMLAEGRMVPDELPVWWERRREHELTPEYLGRVLEEAGVPWLAERARLGHFDDFNAPKEVADGAELLRLVAELRLVGRARPDLKDRLDVIENAARRGEFDATKAESDRWAASLDGQRTMRGLVVSAQEFAQRRRVGRNDLCVCGSGKKFKRCCGA